MPDQDEFARATRSARAIFVVHEQPDSPPCITVDEVVLARWLGKFFTIAGGVPSLVGVLAAVQKLAAAPLLASINRDQALNEIDAAADADGKTDFDLVLRRAATRVVIAGQYDARSIIEQFFHDTVIRYAFDAKRGLVERLQQLGCQGDRARLERDTRHVVSDAAAILLRNPKLERLCLAARYQSKEGLADMDLLGGGLREAN